MKNLILTGLIFLFSIPVFTQVTDTVRVNEIVIGRNFIADSTVTATEYVLPENIYDWAVDDSAKMATDTAKKDTGMKMSADTTKKDTTKKKTTNTLDL